jgi:hypothetical protein
MLPSTSVGIVAAATEAPDLAISFEGMFWQTSLVLIEFFYTLVKLELQSQFLLIVIWDGALCEV